MSEAKEHQVAKRALANALSKSNRAGHALETAKKHAETLQHQVAHSQEQAEAADITAAGSAAAAVAKQEAVTGNPVIYPPVIGTSQRAGEAEATAAELKVAADAAVAGRKYEADQKKAENERVKQLHDAVKRGEMAAPTPQQLAAEKVAATTLVDEIKLREPERKAAELAYKDATRVAKQAAQEDKKAQSAFAAAVKKQEQDAAKAAKLHEKVEKEKVKAAEAEAAATAAETTSVAAAEATLEAEQEEATKHASAEVVRVAAGAAKAGVTEEAFVAAEAEETKLRAEQDSTKKAEADRLRAMSREERALSQAVSAALAKGMDVQAFVMAELQFQKDK